jgi:hypothetical protein
MIMIIHKEGWEQPKCVSSDELIYKIWWGCRMEYYVVTRVLHATTWIYLENLILNEIIHTQKTKVIWFHFYAFLEKARIEIESK